MANSVAGTGGANSGGSGGNRVLPCLFLAAGVLGSLLLLIVVAGVAGVLLWRNATPRQQCHEIVIAFPNRDAEEVDRQVGALLADTDPSMVHRTVAEDGKLTVYARSDQVAGFVKEALGRPPVVGSGASIQAVGQLTELPPEPVSTVRAGLRVTFDRAKLSAMGLSVEEVNRQLGSRLDKAGPDDAESIRNLEVKGPNGQALRLAVFATLEVVNSPSHVVRNYPEDAPAAPSGDSAGR